MSPWEMNSVLAAYGIAFVAVIAYTIFIFSRENKLRRKLTELKSQEQGRLLTEREKTT